MKRTILLCTAVLTISGCATKTYGRLGTVTAFEQDSLTCREINLESAKVQGFLDHVDKESEFSGRDVLAILGDFGVGNVLERTAAIESANKRAEQLRALRVAKSCGASVATAPRSEQARQPAPALAENTGAMSFAVERLAKQSNCQPSSAAALIDRSTGRETYRVNCDNGKQALFICEMRQCRMVN